MEPLTTKPPAQQEIPADDLEQTIGYVQPVEPGLVFAGRYKLREKLGEGGMGVVFVADQIAPVQRRVALKVIRSGLDTRQLLARFEQERQALALMDHPNIAKVFDAGIDEAHRPYFAMELVKGLPLTKYCDEARLSPRQRIELFIPVCQAVQHAHQKGIIHRDLKPSNILVGLYDGRPVPKVIDFGVAKVTGTRLTDQSVYTEIGSIIGTLEYMSPEQAELNNLDIDTRSDVYALGVILYELLTGTVPFSRKELEKAGLAEMLRVIKEEEPHKPSTKLSSSLKLPSIAASRQTEPKKLTALVRGELDWIVMKALEKDRSRRYETANGLGQDVQRYLTGEPVMAAPASTVYRLRKLIRRNKGEVIAGSFVFAALLIGMAGTTWGLFRAEHHRQIAEQNADKALAAAKSEKEAKERAEAQSIFAMASVEKYLVTVTDDLELQQADFHGLRKKLLENALPFYEQIAAKKSDDPDVESGRSRAYHRLAILRAEMGETEAAIQDYESMQAILDQLCTKFPAVREYRQDFAGSLNNLGTLLERLGKHSKSEAVYRHALDIQERLAAEFLDVPKYRKDLAKTLNNLGVLLMYLGKRAESETAFRQALGIQDKLVAEMPNLPECRSDLSGSYNNLGLLLTDLGRRIESEATFRQAIDIKEKLAADFPTVPEYHSGLAMSQNNLGALLAKLGKYSESEAAHRQAMATHQKLTVDFPNMPKYRNDLAANHNRLAALLMDLGKRTESELEYRQALEILAKLVADFPKVRLYRHEKAGSHNNLGALLMDLGRRTESELEYRQALSILERLAPDFPNSPEYRKDLGTNLNNLGILLAIVGKRAESESAYRQAHDILAKLAADFPNISEYRKDLAGNHNNLGMLQADLGKHAESEASYRQAIEIQEKIASENNGVTQYTLDLGGSFCNLGNLMHKFGEDEAALGWYEKAIARMAPVVSHESRLATARQSLRNSHWGKATSLDTLGRHSDAISAWERALELDDGRATNDLRKGVASSYLNMGIVLAGQAKRDDADAAYRTAISIQKKLTEDAPSVDQYVFDLGRSYFYFGLLRQTCGNAETALEWYDSAVATVTPLVSKEPTSDSARLFLSISHWGRAGSLVALGRHSESINDWERALELDDGTSKVAIGTGFAESRLRMRQKDKDATGCIAAATQFESLKRTDADGLYNAAYFRAVCASVVLEDPKTPEADADRLVKEQADLAMAWLHKAVEAGYDNVEHMKTDADLNALRERDDFKKLLEDLTKAKESKNK